MRLPTRINLPFGYTVLVKQVTDAEMRQEADGEPADGLWDCDEKTIYIRKDIPLKRQRYILVHELGHCLWDLQHSFLDEGILAP